MAAFYESISEEIRNFIQKQHLFFVATAPLSGDGHVNLSPKGQDSFRVLSPNQVAYLDFVGSGNETSAHVHENRRITFMFCAFDGAPRILRLFGHGRVVLPASPEWAEMSQNFPPYANIRQIIVADISLVQTSCGYAVPLMDFVQERDAMWRWAEAQGTEGLVEYQHENNVESLDRLPTPLGLAVSRKP